MVYFTKELPEPGQKDAEARHAELAENYTKLVMEYAELNGPYTKALEAEYQLAFGHKETRIFELKLAIQRMRREFSIRQAAASHGVILDDDEVEEQLAEEFQQFREQVEQLHSKLRQAQDFLGGKKLTVAEVKEIKRIFRELAKRLHPDLNADLPPIAEELWRRAMDAYKANDLQELRLVEDMAEEILAGQRASTKTMDPLEVLQQRIVKLEGKIADLKERIAAIQTQFPFTEKELLANPEAVSERRRLLDQQIGDLLARLEEVTAMVQKLRRSRGGQGNG